jgi:S1-C subfamily serine protease
VNASGSASLTRFRAGPKRDKILEVSRLCRLAGICFWLFLELISNRCAAQDKSPSTPAAIYERTHLSVVVIVVCDQDGKPSGQGSGFIVAKDRIATNHHVLRDASSAIVVFADGSTKEAEGIVADSSTKDLAILAVKTGARPPLKMGDELSIHQGDPVYAIGAPRGLELSITNGIVSGFRQLDEQFMIQTTAPIAPGSSGGPLFDQNGRVIGVTTMLLNDSPGIYFSIGSGDLSRLLRTPSLVVTPVPMHLGIGSSRVRQNENGDATLTGTYTGNVHNITANITADFSIVVRENKQAIYGCMIVKPPLYGSGPLQGSFVGNALDFDVVGRAYQIRFQGNAIDGKIIGTYQVALPTPQKGSFELHRTGVSSLPTSFDPKNCLTD